MSQSNAKSMFTALPGAARIEVDDIEIEDNEENLKVSPYLTMMECTLSVKDVRMSLSSF